MSRAGFLHAHAPVVFLQSISVQLRFVFSAEIRVLVFMNSHFQATLEVETAAKRLDSVLEVPSSKEESEVPKTEPQLKKSVSHRPTGQFGLKPFKRRA